MGLIQKIVLSFIAILIVLILVLIATGTIDEVAKGQPANIRTGLPR